MWLTMKSTWAAKIVTVVFTLLTLFWIYLQVAIPEDTEVHTFFGAIYGIVALLGAIFGLKVALKWGFFSSILGRALVMFSLGLLMQEFGQATLSYFHYVYDIEGQYP